MYRRLYSRRRFRIGRLWRARTSRECSPGVAGTLVVHIAITGDGLVHAVDRPAADTGTLSSEAVARCVIDHIKQLRFPAKGRTANPTYAITLSQED